MDKNTNYYKKALEKYYNGEIERALYFCEKGISSSLKNSAALNLKGLLMYLKGNLSEAKALWKLNKDYNKDEVAKKYLESLKDDEERQQLYKKSERLIKEIKFKEALELLLECKKSDFNLIAVQNALTKVYIHLAQYEEAKSCIDKVMEVDKNNKEAKENKKLLVEYRVIEMQQNYKRMGLILGSFLVVTVALFIIIPKLGRDNKDKVNKSDADSIKVSESSNTANNNQENKKEETNKQVETPNKENRPKVEEEAPKKEEEKPKKEEPVVFPTDKLNDALKNKDYLALYNILSSYKLEALKEEDKLSYNRAKAIMETEGVEYFYTIARDFHTKEQYKEALEQYSKLEPYAQKHYFYESIIYMMADCYKSLNEMSKAIEYYGKYLALEDKSSYEDTVLYEMLLIYKDIDINKAKGFAKQIKERFKDSIYNNTVVEEILNSK